LIVAILGVGNKTQEYTENDVNIVAYFADVAWEIAERKQVEEALISSEAELRALFAAMTDVVIVYDAKGRYIKIAPTNPANLYLSPNEILGRNVRDVLPKEPTRSLPRFARLSRVER
jgi:PAS domain-containing protein